MKLNVLRVQYPEVPIVSLTATSTTVVTKDIKKILSMNDPILIRTSLDRKNLEFSVMIKPAKDKLVDMMIQLIRLEFGSLHTCGIIYCYSKKDTETLASELRKKGLKVSFYHAGMGQDDRDRVHDSWLSGKLQVICATIAFGMGIDKPNVRFVFHHTMSKSIENYYQEAGRAGDVLMAN